MPLFFFFDEWEIFYCGCFTSLESSSEFSFLIQSSNQSFMFETLKKESFQMSLCCLKFLKKYQELLINVMKWNFQMFSFSLTWEGEIVKHKTDLFIFNEQKNIIEWFRRKKEKLTKWQTWKIYYLRLCEWRHSFCNIAKKKNFSFKSISPLPSSTFVGMIIFVVKRESNMIT